MLHYGRDFSPEPMAKVRQMFGTAKGFGKELVKKSKCITKNS